MSPDPTEKKVRSLSTQCTSSPCEWSSEELAAAEGIDVRFGADVVIPEIRALMVIGELNPQ